MKKILRLSESDLTRVIRRVINEGFSDIDWTNIWLKLRRLSESFHYPDDDGIIFSYGGLDFEISRDGDSLHLMEFYRNPREWDSKYRDGEEVLENYFNKIKKFVDEFNDKYDFPFELMFEMGPRFEMIFYCNFENNLYESKITSSVISILNEDRSKTITKPNGFDNYNKKCKNQTKGSFDIVLNKVRFSCMTNEDKTNSFNSSESNPFTAKTRGNYSVSGNNITLSTTL